MNPPHNDVLARALIHLGHVSIDITPLDGDAYAFDRHDHTLYIDPECGDIMSTIRHFLASMAPGRHRLELVAGDGHPEDGPGQLVTETWPSLRPVQGY